MSVYSLRELKRWATLRCAYCGHRFRLKRDPRNSFGRPREVYHSPCISLVESRREADERLEILSAAMGIGGITASDVQQVIELRSRSEDERIAMGDKAWRVFYALQQRRLDE